MRTLRRWVRRVSWLTTFAFLAAFPITYLLLARIPAWYAPALLPRAEQARVRRDASRWADDVSDHMVRRRPFEVELVEHEVNEFLASLAAIAPDIRNHWPPELVEPAVSFTPGEIRFGAKLDKPHFACILSISLSARVAGDGRSIVLEPRRVRGGALPIPMAVLERVFGPLLEQARLTRAEGPPSNALSAALRDADTVADLFEGVSLPNTFIWPNGRRRFRIRSIDVRDGTVVVGVDPW